MLDIKDKTSCRWDLVSLGEILLRFDPGEERIHSSRRFTVWDGGAEYNVAVDLSRVFGERTTIATALADNALGRLAEGLAKAAGLDVSRILWRDDDGIGRNTRNGLYFIERGFGLRAPTSVFDRANTAISQMRPDEIHWDDMLGNDGSRWFHTGGVFAGLSELSPDTAITAMRAAREYGSVVSFDLNYRNSLWAWRGGRDAANELNRTILPHADVVFGTFGFDSRLSHYTEAAFRSAAEMMISHFPNLKMIVSSLRETHSASRHDFGGVCYIDGEIFRSRDHIGVDVLDRVGSGDAFAAGFIYSILEARGGQFAIDCAAALGALTMTTPGDGSLATMNEVLELIEGGNAAAKR